MCGGGLWAALCGVWAALFCVFASTSGFSSVLLRTTSSQSDKSPAVQHRLANMPLGRSDATPHHSYFAALAVVVIIVLAVLPFACEGPLRRWNKSRRGRLE